MARCPRCNAVIPQMDCKNCPEIVPVRCIKCGKIVNIKNEAHLNVNTTR